MSRKRAQGGGGSSSSSADDLFGGNYDMAGAMADFYASCGAGGSASGSSSTIVLRAQATKHNTECKAINVPVPPGVEAETRSLSYTAMAQCTQCMPWIASQCEDLYMRSGQRNEPRVSWLRRTLSRSTQRGINHGQSGVPKFAYAITPRAAESITVVRQRTMLSFVQIFADDPAYALSIWELELVPRVCVHEVIVPEALVDYRTTEERVEHRSNLFKLYAQKLKAQNILRRIHPSQLEHLSVRAHVVSDPANSAERERQYADGNFLLVWIRGGCVRTAPGCCSVSGTPFGRLLALPRAAVPGGGNGKRRATEASKVVTWGPATTTSGTVYSQLIPLLLLAGSDRLEPRVRLILEAFADRPHVFNLGHGIDRRTPIEHVDRLIATVRSFKG